jgi:hypothetical protein
VRVLEPTSMDAVRYAAVGLTLAELCVLCVYYFPLVAQVPWGESSMNAHAFDDNYVSDILFKDQTYKALVTIFVILQMLMCTVFVMQLNHKPGWHGTLLLELACLAVACVGWIILTSFFTDAEGHLTSGHIVGTVLFIAGSGVYFLLMLFNAGFVYTFKRRGEAIAMFFTAVAFVMSLAAGSVFVVSFIDKQVPFGWMYEHAALIFLAAAHVMLFFTDALIAAEEQCSPASDSVASSVAAVSIGTSDLVSGTARK